MLHPSSSDDQGIDEAKGSSFSVSAVGLGIFSFRALADGTISMVETCGDSEGTNMFHPLLNHQSLRPVDVSSNTGVAIPVGDVLGYLDKELFFLYSNLTWTIVQRRLRPGMDALFENSQAGAGRHTNLDPINRSKPQLVIFCGRLVILRLMVYVKKKVAILA